MARATGNVEKMLKVLVPMTAMVPALPALAIRQAGSVEVVGLPSDADLSHLTDEQLAAITGRPSSSTDAAPPPRRRKKARKESSPASPPAEPPVE